MSEAGPDLMLETDREGMESKDKDPVLSSEIGMTTELQPTKDKKEDTQPTRQEWTLETSIRATKSPPSKESLKAFVEGLRERAYGSTVSVRNQEANMFVRALQKDTAISDEDRRGDLHEQGTQEPRHDQLGSFHEPGTQEPG